MSSDKDGQYRRGRERKLGVADELAALAFAGKRIVVAQQDGRVLVLDTTDLKIRNEFRPAGKNEPYLAKAAPNGRWFAVLFHNGTLALIGPGGSEPTKLRGTVSAVAFDDKGRLFVADRATRVTEYGLEPLRLAGRREPAMSMLHATYRYAILPFYTVFPKPGELGNVVHYVLTDEISVVPGGGPEAADLRQARANLDIYGPVFSSLGFVVVMLGVTCVYICRTDF